MQTERYSDKPASAHSLWPLLPTACEVCFSLQLLLLNEATVVLVDDGEGLLHIFGALAGQAACLEELLVIEGVSS